MPCYSYSFSSFRARDSFPTWIIVFNGFVPTGFFRLAAAALMAGPSSWVTLVATVSQSLMTAPTCVAFYDSVAAGGGGYAAFFFSVASAFFFSAASALFFSAALAYFFSAALDLRFA